MTDDLVHILPLDDGASEYLCGEPYTGPRSFDLPATFCRECKGVEFRSNLRLNFHPSRLDDGRLVLVQRGPSLNKVFADIDALMAKHHIGEELTEAEWERTRDFAEAILQRVDSAGSGASRTNQ